MKKINVITTVLVASSLLATAVAFSEDADMDRSHPKEFVRDSVITTKVKSKLAAQHLASLARVHVDTDRDGVVWLSGTTHSREAADKAVELARETENVRDVHDDIRVTPGK
jgi:hyperosmotically inducible protein